MNIVSIAVILGNIAYLFITLSGVAPLHIVVPAAIGCTLIWGYCGWLAGRIHRRYHDQEFVTIYWDDSHECGARFLILGGVLTLFANVMVYGPIQHRHSWDMPSVHSWFWNPAKRK